MKTVKTVQFCKGKREPVITVKNFCVKHVRSYYAAINPPRAKITPAIIENGIMKYGF